MKNFKNLDGILAVLLALFIGAACCGRPGTYSHKDFCVTPDGSRIGIKGMLGETALIDAATGRIAGRADDDSASGAIVCSDGGEVISVYNKLAVRLAGEKRIEQAAVRGKIIGITRDREIVSYSGGRSHTSDSDRGEPLEIYLKKLGDMSEDAKPSVKVSLDKFEGLRTTAGSYYILPVRLLSGGELLIAAGAVPGAYQYGDNIETKVSPEQWGFFTLDLQNGKVRKYGATKTGDAVINFLDPPRVFATADGRFLAVMSGYHTGNALAVFDAETDREMFRRPADDDFEIMDVIVSEDGTRAAAAVKYYRQLRRGTTVDYRVKIYDVGAKEEVKEIPIKNVTPYLIDFRDNELTVSHYSDSVSRIDTQTGETIWETVFPEKK